MLRSSLASLLVLAALGVAGPCRGADLGVTASQLVVDDIGSGHVRFDIRRAKGVSKGPAPASKTDPAGLDGTLQLFYTDAPDSVAGAFLIPAPWKKNRPKQARFVNRSAPAGPSAVRSVAVVEGKSVTFIADGRGDGQRLFDLGKGSPTAAAGVTVILTIHNAIDGSTHRMCTRFSTVDGSKVSLKMTRKGHRLVARRGVPAPCIPVAPLPASVAGCEVLNSTECLLPYPSSFFLTPAATPTGFQLSIPQQGIPAVHGTPVPASLLSDVDGFSPGVQILMNFPQGVDPEKSNASRLLPAACCGQPAGPPWIDTRTYDGRSLDLDSPTVLIDANTGERIIHFIEPDARAKDPRRQILFLRPGKLLTAGHRYLVAMRNLVAPNGDPVVAEPAFAALRDGVPSADPNVESRRPQLETVFTALAANGVARGDLVLAFDFVVQSQSRLTDRILSMRDQAYAWLDGVAADSLAKPFTVTNMTEHDCNQPGQVVARDVSGTFQSPLFLKGDLDDATTPFDNLDAHGVPVQNGFTNANFSITIPCTALAPGAVSRPLILGHGLFQDGALFTSLIPPVVGQVGTWDAVTAATDWRGLSSLDIAWVTAHIIGVGTSQLQNFPAFPARLRQGMLNTLVLTRMVKLGIFNRDPALQIGGNGVFPGPSADVYYFGVSLGGIMGTYFAGLTPDIDRFALDVPGVNFSCLLQRATPFESFDSLLGSIGISDATEVSLGIQLVHELWASAEPVADAAHITTDPLPGSGNAKKVVLNVAWLDNEVSNMCTEVEARTLGLSMLEGSIQQGLQQIPDVTGPQESGVIYWDLGELDILNPAQQKFLPPLANLYPSGVCDPHPRRASIPDSIMQLNAFLQPNGMLEDFCTGLCDGKTADEQPLLGRCMPPP